MSQMDKWNKSWTCQKHMKEQWTTQIFERQYKRIHIYNSLILLFLKNLARIVQKKKNPTYFKVSYMHETTIPDC